MSFSRSAACAAAPPAAPSACRAASTLAFIA
jgi:hypothetical protein